MRLPRLLDSLVVSNIRQRPTRTLVSVAGVALGVILVAVNTGLVRGMLNDRIRREQGIGAEIQFTRKGSSVISPSTILSLDVRYSDRLRQIAGVREASPVGRHIQAGSSGLGLSQIDGIDLKSYVAISGMKIISGRAFESDDEVIIDDFKAHQESLGPGNTMEVFGKKLRIVGVFAPQSGSRIKMSLDAMQKLHGTPGKCTFILVKVDDPSQQEEVLRRIDAELPGNYVWLTREVVTGFERSIPGLDGFVKAVLALSAIVSTLVILLAMYTTITERTREIGILKSLGASKRFIIGVIEQEALAISLIGVVVGLIAAFVIGWGIERWTSLTLEFHGRWILIAALIGILGGAVGALYPAMRAAQQDPVKALAYE
jgi:putative ABC transport system permease protein